MVHFQTEKWPPTPGIFNWPQPVHFGWPPGLNFSQEYVAAEVGIATRHYQDLEYGVAANPKLETLCRMADVLETTVGDLLDSRKMAKPTRERATKADLKPMRAVKKKR